MNKQEIEKAIGILEEIYPSQKEIKTGEYDHVADALDLAVFALQQQLTGGWIPVSERLPENEKEVEVTVERRYEDKTCRRRFTCRAIYEDGTMWREDSGFSWKEFVYVEYDEEQDDYKVPEGWYEAVSYAEEFAVIGDSVIAWQPLPEPYIEGESR